MLQIVARCGQTGSWPLYTLLLGVLCLLLHFPVWIPFIATLHRMELDSRPWTICSTHYSFSSCQFTHRFPPERWCILGLRPSSNPHWPYNWFLPSSHVSLVHPHLGLQSKCVHYCFPHALFCSKNENVTQIPEVLRETQPLKDWHIYCCPGESVKETVSPKWLWPSLAIWGQYLKDRSWEVPQQLKYSLKIQTGRPNSLLWILFFF